MATNKSSLTDFLDDSLYSIVEERMNSRFHNKLLNLKIKEYEKHMSIYTVPYINDVMVNTLNTTGNLTIPIIDTNVTSGTTSITGRTVNINAIKFTNTSTISSTGSKFTIDPKYYVDTYLIKDYPVENYIPMNIDSHPYNYSSDLIGLQTDIVSRCKVDERGEIYLYLNEYILNGKNQYSIYRNSDGKMVVSVSGAPLPIKEGDVVFTDQLYHRGSFFILSRQITPSLDYIKPPVLSGKNAELNPEDEIEIFTVSPDHVHKISFNVDELYLTYGIKGKSLERHVVQESFLFAKSIVTKRQVTNKNTTNVNNAYSLPISPTLEISPVKAPSSTQLELF